MTYEDVVMKRLEQDGIYECVVDMFKAKQAEIARLNKVIYIAAGMISTTEKWADKHPMEVVDMLNREVGSDG